jgi:hypothetical protein
MTLHADPRTVRAAPVVAGRWLDVLIALFAGLADLAVVALWVALHTNVALLLLAHFGIVGLLAAALTWRFERGEDTALAQLTLVTTLVMGPLGALATLLILPWAGVGGPRAELLSAWYERIARSQVVEPASALSEAVASGRTLDLSAPVPPSFSDVIDHGSLAARQKALGLIARKFHPEYARALKAALRSGEPVVRVQAAAVAARVRGQLQARIRDLVDRLESLAAEPRAALAAAAELDAAASSGLLMEGDRQRASAAESRLRQVAAADRGLLVAPLPLAERTLLETELLDGGRFAEFRRARRVARIVGHGGYHIRRRAPAAGRRHYGPPARGQAA